MAILMYTSQGAIAFNLVLQNDAVPNKAALVKHFPKLSKGLKLLDSPYISFTTVIEDDAEDCENIS